jgi:sulfide:quinone oxidoreductase
VRAVEVLENVAVQSITPNQVLLADGRTLPFAYGMLLPPFRGPQFLRAVPDLTDAYGFMPVLPTYQHPHYANLYGVGVVVQIQPPEVTPIPVGVPKTGQMTEAMGMAVAHNIARELGVIAANPVTPILQAICFADFGDTGIVFLADQVLPDPVSGTRRRAIAHQDIWVSWVKTAFERYFLAKMRWGVAVPWFERLALKGVDLRLIDRVS